MKEKFASKGRLLAVVPLALLLGACATSGGMSFPEFADAGESGQTAYGQQVDKKVETKERFDSIQRKLLLAGFPATFEDEDGSTYTKQWDKEGRTLTYRYKYTTGAMGIETSAFITVAAEADKPVPLLVQHRQTGQWMFTVVAANVATQEGLGRTLLKLVGGVIGSALNGAVAADISKCNDCGGPGVVNLVQGGAAVAASRSDSGSVAGVNARVDVNSKGSVPMH